VTAGIALFVCTEYI